MPKGVYERRWNPISNLKVGPVVPWQERFWRHVQKTDGCWIWIGAKDGRGYGKLQVGTSAKPKLLAAHRASWEIHHGSRPTRYVLHSCDNPPCVRPDHLFEGGIKENTADKVAKGRQTKGTTHPFAKLTVRQVRELRATDWSITNQSAVAKRYGISPATLHNAIHRKTYKSVS